jgi:hypothetical protein
MSQQNLISFSISESDLNDVNSAIATLKTKLYSKLKTLSTADRVEMPKMGDKTTAFVQKSYEYAKQNADLIPAFLNLDDFNTDVQAIDTLRSVYIQLEQITDAIDDTLVLSGSEAYQAALIFYNSVKNGAKAKIGNSETIYADLSSRFPGPKQAKKAGETQAK